MYVINSLSTVLDAVTAAAGERADIALGVGLQYRRWCEPLDQCNEYLSETVEMAAWWNAEYLTKSGFNAKTMI